MFSIAPNLNHVAILPCILIGMRYHGQSGNWLSAQSALQLAGPRAALSFISGLKSIWLESQMLSLSARWQIHNPSALERS